MYFKPVYFSYLKSWPIIAKERGQLDSGENQLEIPLETSYRQTVLVTSISNWPVQAISLRNPRPCKHLPEVLPFTSHIIGKDKGLTRLVVLDSVFGLENN